MLHSGKSRLDGTDTHSHAVCVGHEFDLVNRDLKTSKSRIDVATIIPSFLRHIDATIFGNTVINYGGFHIYENPVFRPVAIRFSSVWNRYSIDKPMCAPINLSIKILKIPAFGIHEVCVCEFLR